MIDIKKLRIGSHVSIDGKRVRVVGIRTTSSMSGLPIVQYTTAGVVRFGEMPSESADLEPIEITPALLEELGFEQRRREYPYGSPDVWYIDPESAQLEKDGKDVVSNVIFCSLEKVGRKDLWEIKALSTIDGNFPIGNVFACRYLHEAEAFLALHDVELIPD